MSHFFTYLAVSFFCSFTYAKFESPYSHYKRLSFDFQYTTFNDLVTNSANEVLTLEPILNINMNFRFYRSFSLILSHGASKEWNYSGAGLRVDLPGVFFIGTLPTDSIRKTKKRNWNSYISFSKLLATTEGQPDDFVCDRAGFGLDAFVFADLYLNVEANLFSYQGNQFFSPVIGVGFEF